MDVVYNRSLYSDSTVLVYYYGPEVCKAKIYNNQDTLCQMISNTASHFVDLKHLDNQRELFLSEADNRETIPVIEANNDMYCLQRNEQKSSCCFQ